MTQPTQRQVDADLERSMDLFTRAKVGDAGTLDGISPTRVLVALDGSSQDLATAQLTRQLAERLKCEVGYALIADSPEVSFTPQAAADFTALSATEVSVPVSTTEEDEPGKQPTNYDSILAAATEYQADLLVVPCPFGRDFESLGEDSTGTVVDVLTARWKAPLIVTRRPDATGRDPTNHLRIILTGENPAAEQAARLAVGLVQPGGRLELLLLVEKSFYEKFREALQSLQPGTDVSYEDLENALARTFGRLHASLQRTSSAVGFTYELLIRHEGDELPITPEDPKTHPALMVLAMQRSSLDSQGEVQEFIRRSPHPVLVASVE